MRSIKTLMISYLLFLFGCANNYAGKTEYVSRTSEFKSNTIPPEVFEMKDLRMLSIEGMDCDYRQSDANGTDITQCWDIEKIPPQIKNLENLEILSLELNAISVIPNELTELKKLKTLDLSENPGLSNANIYNLTKITSLENLYLVDCGLSKLPENIGDLKKLKTLSLINDQIPRTEQLRLKAALPKCVMQFK